MSEWNQYKSECYVESLALAKEPDGKKIAPFWAIAAGLFAIADAVENGDSIIKIAEAINNNPFPSYLDALENIGDALQNIGDQLESKGEQK